MQIFLLLKGVHKFQLIWSKKQKHIKLSKYNGEMLANDSKRVWHERYIYNHFLHLLETWACFLFAKVHYLGDVLPNFVPTELKNAKIAHYMN